jgi:multiple sugar transport system permease protein
MIAAVRTSLPRWAWWAVCSCFAVVFLYPLYVMATQSIKAPDESVSVPPTHVPGSFSLDNYAALGDGSANGLDLWANVSVSVRVTIAATLGTLLLSTLAGYGFARLRFPGSNLVFFLSLATFMIPFQAIITPLYTVLQNMGLQNSLVGLTLVYITFQLPFGIFLMRNSFAALPRELEEAAMVDGCGPLSAMWRVMLPVAIPGLITTALLTFFVCWNEFFAALILISDQSKFPLPVALTLIASGNLNTLNWGGPAGRRPRHRRALHRHLPAAPAVLHRRAVGGGPEMSERAADVSAHGPRR